MTKAPTLQALLEKHVSELPRRLAGELIREKLQPLGCADNDALVETVVDQLLNGGDGETFELGDEFDGLLPPDFILAFDDADIAGLEARVAMFTEGLPDLVKGSANAAAGTMLRSYKKRWSEWRPHVVADMNAFKANLEARWHKGFDLLRMLIELSRDEGSAFQRRARRSQSGRRDHLNTALTNLHARAIQVACEIMTLMESGFADGAMARWRTLHEITCVAMVLDEGGDELAQRYLTHEFVEAKKALTQYQQGHEALGYAPFPKRKARRIERDYAAVVAKYGKDFGNDYGWVAGRLNIPRPNFSHVEAAAGRAMMRSHYKLASHNVHAGAKGIAHRLGAFDPGYSGIAGASNIGFVEPGQNMGLSLLHFTMLLLPKRWTVDTIALLSALVELQSKIAPELAKSERSIARDERRIRRARALKKQASR